MPVFVKSHRRAKSVVKAYIRSERVMDKLLTKMGQAKAGNYKDALRGSYKDERKYNRRVRKVLIAKLGKTGRTTDFRSYERRLLRLNY